MKIECIHGYFKFEETRPGQISHFASLMGFTIARAGDHFTFGGLVDAPDYSLAGGEFLGAETSETFEGQPWDVMRANRLVYDFTRGRVIPIESVFRPVQVSAAGFYLVSPGMILPGSVKDDGSRVTDYAAFFTAVQFRYSEVSYEQSA